MQRGYLTYIAKISESVLRRRVGEKLRKPPIKIVGMLLVALSMQLGYGAIKAQPMVRAEDLAAPPSQPILELLALGDKTAFSRILMIWLQNFDNQPGLALRFTNLDYENLAKWLNVILAIDPKSDYPLFAALNFYVLNPDKQRTRRMLQFLHDQYQYDPKKRWRWLAFAAVTAKHRLKDDALALKFLNDLDDKVGRGELPRWVLGVKLSVMRSLGELESARVLVGGMLHSGKISEPSEIKFLSDWLEALEKEQEQSKNRE